ncbi:hypothetical protein [Anaerosporobacter sp.]|uniref:hypothetical protein n=1 Tax=Anaerosporobacter sp. TaxID=1872529 RepID=UPI00286F871D|nr:hypothetical protein [Anaerosporobacter sp.]
MFQNQYPHFEKDSILKAGMLVNLREYPRDMFALMYQDYSDGIIQECRLLLMMQKRRKVEHYGLSQES